MKQHNFCEQLELYKWIIWYGRKWEWMASSWIIQTKNLGMSKLFLLASSFLSTINGKEEATTFRWTEIEPGWPGHFLIKIQWTKKKNKIK